MHPGVRHQVGSSASRLGVGINLLLVALKLAAGVLSGSVSAVADGLNNLMDAAASIITWAGLRWREEADAASSSHSRYECLAGLGAAVLIMVVGVELARSGVGRSSGPHP